MCWRPICKQQKDCGSKNGAARTCELPLPRRERGGVGGGGGWVCGAERSEPPHPRPLPAGERESSSHRQDEQPREAQQHLAVVARLIGADDFPGIGGEKFFAVGGA